MILNLPGTQNITVLVFIPVFIYLKTSGKVATSGWSFQPLEMKIGHKFSTAVEVLVAKGKILVAYATVLVTISSPEFTCNYKN